MNEFRSKVFGNGSEPVSLLPTKAPKSANTKSGLRTIAVQRKEIRTLDTREGDRHRLSDEAITATYDGRTHEVQLVNLSGGGAMISADFEPMLWDRVDLNLMDSATVECVVQWVRDDRIGLEFAQETRIDCAPEERNALLRDVLARNFPEAKVAIEPPAASVESPVQAAPQGEHKRAEPRHPLVWSGVVHYNHTSTPVRLRNISSQGALIECHDGVPEGAELLLDLGEAGSLFATVSWTVGDQVGLAFQQPFDMKLLALSRPDVASSRWEAPDYLKDQNRPKADPWGRLSVSELSSELEGFLKR